MPQSESFDAFYARTSWNVTNQVHALAGEDPLADHAIREAYARAYQQWYEVSTYPDPEAWVLGVANEAYQRRVAEAAALSNPGVVTGHDPLSWPGMWRPMAPASEPPADPDATLDPRLTAPAGPGAVGPDVAHTGPLPGAASDWFAPAPAGTAGSGSRGSDHALGWPEQHAGTPTATIGERADLPPTAARPGSPRPGRPVGGLTPGLLSSPRKLIVLATVVVVLAAGGVYFLLSGGISRHAATPPGSPGHTGKPTAHMLPAGQTGDRAAIPWSLIGSGWTLAEVSTARATAGGSPTGGADVTYLVDPEGGKYRIRTIYGSVAPELVAWSGDAKVALYAMSGAPGGPAASYGLLRLASGGMTPLPLPAGVFALGFTRPDGLNIVAVQQTSSKYRLERYNFEGVRQATIGTMPRPAGAPSFVRLGAMSSPDGTTAVWGVDGAGLQLVSNAGGLIRKLRMPGTGSPKSCTPMSWWNADTVLAYCGASGQQGTGRLWLAPVGGGQPAPLTGISGSLSGQGYLTGAWQLDGSVYVTSTTLAECPGTPSGPGGQQILQVSSGGGETTVRIPASTNNHASVVAGVNGRLLVLAQTSCPGTSSLIWFNPSTRAAQTVLTASSGEAGVLGAVPYGSGPAAIAG